jgi:putative transposase
LITPERRRRAVVALTERFGVSERRACSILGQHRSTQRSCRRPLTDTEAKLRRRLRQFAKTHPRLGWKKAHDVLRREGWALNAKRTRRLWRSEGLKRPPTCRKRRRLYLGTAVRRQATRPNEVWAIDFQFDETADWRRLKLTNIVDEFTREALATEVNRSSGADDLIDVIERLVAERGAPAFIRCDNGPELTAWALRDWCRLSKTTKTLYIEPGSPWENPYVESFNGRMRDELLNIEEFGSLTEARIVVEAWRMEYNTWRPHSSLGGLTPVEFASRWAPEHAIPGTRHTTPVLTAPQRAT